jgi:C-terminal processing protease CtpA/Prc
MIPNLPDYKIIKLSSRNPIGIHLKTTYTTPKSSIFNFFSEEDTEVQQYPIVSKIEENSEAYNEGLRVGHKIIKLNGHTLEYKDIKTLLSDFTYERKTSDFITLTVL